MSLANCLAACRKPNSYKAKYKFHDFIGRQAQFIRYKLNPASIPSKFGKNLLPNLRCFRLHSKGFGGSESFSRQFHVKPIVVIVGEMTYFV